MMSSYKLRVIPLESYKGNLHFGITTTTSQQTIQQLQQRFTDVRTTFSIISDAGTRSTCSCTIPRAGDL